MTDKLNEELDQDLAMETFLIMFPDVSNLNDLLISKYFITRDMVYGIKKIIDRKLRGLNKIQLLILSELIQYCEANPSFILNLRVTPKSRLQINALPEDFMTFFHKSELSAKVSEYIKKVYSKEENKYLGISAAQVDTNFKKFAIILLEEFATNLSFIKTNNIYAGIEEEPLNAAIRVLSSHIKDSYVFKPGARGYIGVDGVNEISFDDAIGRNNIGKVISLDHRPTSLYRYIEPISDSSVFALNFPEQNFSLDISREQLSFIILASLRHVFGSIDFIRDFEY